MMAARCLSKLIFVALVVELAIPVLSQGGLRGRIPKESEGAEDQENKSVHLAEMEVVEAEIDQGNIEGDGSHAMPVETTLKANNHFPRPSHLTQYAFLQGFCRTPEDGPGTFKRISADISRCERACTNDEFCLAYEFSGHNSCELHTSFITQANGKHDASCYVKAVYDLLPGVCRDTKGGRGVFASIHADFLSCKIKCTEDFGCTGFEFRGAGAVQETAGVCELHTAAIVSSVHVAHASCYKKDLYQVKEGFCKGSQHFIVIKADEKECQAACTDSHGCRAYEISSHERCELYTSHVDFSGDGHAKCGRKFPIPVVTIR